MLYRILPLLIFLFAITIQGNSQDKKSVNASRVDSKIKIDGKLLEEKWHLTEVATDFFQYSPYNGDKPSEKTQVRFLYDDQALYVGAFMEDHHPDQMSKSLGKRDDFNLADYIGVTIDPYNDASTAYGFYVTASGVQVDVKTTSYSDYGWNAVWESAVHHTPNGWSVEMRIPYSALRFSKQKSHEWGLNIKRSLQRKRETSTWNFIDINVDGQNKQAGVLKGIKNVEPPVRLAFIPYASTYIENYEGDNSYSLKGGMDVKYGINESFTLDMMLIPDFGQVKSDNNVLNLGPYETYYGENREFFKEGTELFNRAGLFYSRRIGATPDDANDVEDIAEERSSEVIENPGTTQLINATKISGKTKNGISVGFLNAMSSHTNAVIKDSLTGEKENITTQPFTNYNVSVIEKTLKDNSYISLINTNLYKPNKEYVANVSGTEGRYEFGKEIAFSGAASLSQKYDLDNPFGHSYWADISRISGRFRFSLYHRTESKTYDPNDMGYLSSADERAHRFSLYYAIREPFWKLLNWYNNIHVYYFTMYDYDKFVSSQINFSTRITTPDHLSIGLNMQTKPVRGYNYHEPRVDGAKFHNVSWQNSSFWLSSDYTKTFAYDLKLGGWTGNQYDQSGFWFEISPRLRLGDKFSFIYNFNSDNDFNSIGYVDNNSEGDTIIFGRRNYRKVEQTINLDYIFTANSSLSFYLRHYWSRVKYKDFWYLNTDGSLRANTEYNENEDINYNAFNIDLAYTWQFAPGSEMSVVWKNEVNTSSDYVVKSFRENLEQTFNDPGKNSISLRVLYYIDYLQLKNAIL
ncbi:MAG: DUF5916 domain-containing protein [Salinivirgaceae bacterium]